MAVALAPAERLREIYGSEFGTRLSDALSLCIKYAKLHYENNPLASDWRPPLEGFYLGEMRSSLSENIEDGLMRAAMQCSSFAVGLDARNLKKLSVLSRSKRQTWGKDIQEAV